MIGQLIIQRMIHPFRTFFVLRWSGVVNAPQVLNRQETLVQWLRQSLRLWVVLGLCALFSWWAAPKLATYLVDLYYPLGKQDFGSSLAGFFDGSTAKLKALRAQRYKQFLWGGYALAAVLALSELLLSFAFLKSAATQRVSAGDTLAHPDEVTLVVPLPAVDGLERTQVLAPGASADVTQVLSRLEPGVAPSSEFIGNGRYHLDFVLGKGGAGLVYKAFDTRLQRAVAVKQLMVLDDGEGDFVRRFEQEARTLAALSHPHIVAVHDFVVERGQFWMVQELLTGGDLKALIRQRHFLLPQDALSITRDIASALGHAHGKQIVHRDIKPENIMRAEDGRWKLTDFGIAKQQSSDIKTQFGLVIGSLAYLSPEQAAGAPVDGRSDIYSLGISLHEMLTGELPFKGDIRQVLAQHVTQGLPVLEHVSAQVNGLLQRMTAKAPEDRFPDCGALLNAIDECMAQFETT